MGHESPETIERPDSVNVPPNKEHFDFATAWHEIINEYLADPKAFRAKYEENRT
jgi:hypothetical protein